VFAIIQTSVIAAGEHLVVRSLKAADRMDRTVARLNIEHFRSLLAAEADDGKRQMILRLLAEEEAKLAALEDPPEETKKSR